MKPLKLIELELKDAKERKRDLMKQHIALIEQLNNINLKIDELKKQLEK